MTSRVLIVQREHTGHRLSFVAMLTAHAHQAGLDVVLLAPPGTAGSPEWQEHLSKLEPNLELIEGPAQLEHALRIARRERINRIVFPDGDSYLLPLLRRWRRSREATISVLVMRAQGQPSSRAFVTFLKSGVKLALRRLTASIAQAQVFTLTSALNPRPRRYEVRDPIQRTALEAPSTRHFTTPDRPWIGVVGSLHVRKNIALIAESILALPSLHRCGLLLAGKQSYEVRLQVEEFAQRFEDAGVGLRVVNRTLTDEELIQAVDEVELLAIAHSNEGASGILGIAAVRGVRVLCGGAESLRRDIGWHPQLGSWVPLEVEAISRGLESGLSTAKPDPVPSVGSPLEFARTLLGD